MSHRPRLVATLIALALTPIACGPQTNGPAPSDDGFETDDGSDDGSVTDDGGADASSTGDGNAIGPGVCDNPLDLNGCGCNTPNLTRACYSGPAPTENKGLCKDGTQTCIANGEFSQWGPCTGDITPTAEICNDNLDHNCNGLTGCNDPACAGKTGCCMPGQTRKCYSGPMGTDNIGTCHDGSQICTAEGAWPVACTGDSLPSPEAGHCHDGIDNDCNGLIDCKDPACFKDPGCLPKQCQPGATEPCYTGPQNTSGVGACKSGISTCDQNGMWSANCVGQVLPGVELGHCHDGIDNDCNGLTDCMDFICLLDPGCQPNLCMPNATRSCYSGPQGTSGVGPCKSGTQTCANDGKSWGACMGEVDPQPEGAHCNDNIDNDCNGLTDCKDPACVAAPNCCVPGNNMVDTTLYANSSDSLYTLNPNNWALSLVGNFNNGDQMTDIAVTPNGNLYGVSFTTLYAIDKNTAMTTLIGPVPGSGNNSLTFLDDGSLLAADSSGEVNQIDPMTGAVMDIGNFQNGLSSSGDMVAIGDGTMYGVSSTNAGGGDATANNLLLRVNTKNGQATVIGPIGFGNVWGLAYANAQLVGFTNTGQILQINPGTGKGVQIANKGIQFWGAGMSPLTPANQCP